MTRCKIFNKKLLFFIVIVTIFAFNFIILGQSHEINLVLAIDTSGSTAINREYLQAIQYAIPNFLNYEVENNKSINVGLVSWDDNIDFMIKPTKNYEQIYESLGKLLSEGNTDLDVAINGSVSSMEPLNNTPLKNIILIITNPSEYHELSYFPDKNKYVIYCIMIDAHESGFIKHLAEITHAYNGEVFATLSSGGEVTYFLENIIKDYEQRNIEQGQRFAKRLKTNQSVIKNKINKSSKDDIVYFSNLFIDSDLIYNQSVIDRNLVFYNCIFNGSVDFSRTTFFKKIEFYNNYFGPNISNNNFNKSISFAGSNFNESAIFESSEFSGPTDFSNSNFHKFVNFNNSNFNASAKFLMAKFEWPTFFLDSNFNERADFSGSEFNSTAEFNNSNFNGFSGFLRTRFNGAAAFVNSNFNGDSRFDFSQFGKSANFRFANFNKTASFSRSNLNGSIDFRYSEFRESLELTKTKINRIEDLYWPYYVNRLICEDSLTYMELIRSLRDLGQYGSADDIYFQYREWRRDQTAWTDLAKWTDFLALFSCGYGVKPQNTIACGIFVLIIFSLIYYLIIKLGFSHDEYSPKANSFQKLIESICFSAIALLSAPKEFYPQDEAAFNNHIVQIKKLPIIKFLPIVERLIGWGLLILLINALSKVMIRL